jgi:hypothetical protein
MNIKRGRGRPKGRKNTATITIQLEPALKVKVKELYGRKTNAYILWLIETDLGGLPIKPALITEEPSHDI